MGVTHNSNAYTFGDPINSSDPSGESTGIPPLWAIQAGAQVAEQAVARRAAEEAAARAEAERKLAEMQAAEAAFIATYMSGGGGGEGVEEEEWYEEEGGEEYANYHTRALEREASFGPGVGVAVVGNGEGRIEDAVGRSPLESEEGGSREVPPSERCGAESNAGVASGVAHREYVQGRQCRKHKPSWYKNHYYARVRDSNGDWHKLFDTYCGIVGGAALTPGVDVFGAPAEVGCAGYGVYRAVETIIEAL